MKSMCQEARRNSPSVADCRPTSSCILIASGISSSSTARSSAAEILPGREVLTRLQQPLGAEQAADVIGAERGAGPTGHGCLSSCGVEGRA